VDRHPTIGPKFECSGKCEQFHKSAQKAGLKSDTFLRFTPLVRLPALSFAKSFQRLCVGGIDEELSRSPFCPTVERTQFSALRIGRTSNSDQRSGATRLRCTYTTIELKNSEVSKIDICPDARNRPTCRTSPEASSLRGTACAPPRYYTSSCATGA
jgi:hypothetical protein